MGVDAAAPRWRRGRRPHANTKWRPLAIPRSILPRAEVVGESAAGARWRRPRRSGSRGCGRPRSSSRPGGTVTGTSVPARPFATSFSVPSPPKATTTSYPPSRASRPISVAWLLRLGDDRLHVVAALQRVDDEVLEPIRDRRRVRVDDDQHPLLRAAARRRALREPPRRAGGASVAVGPAVTSPPHRLVTLPDRLEANDLVRPRPRGRARPRRGGRRAREPRDSVRKACVTATFPHSSCAIS